MNLNKINSLIKDGNPGEQLGKLSSVFNGRIIFTTSFGIEDQVISHFIFTNNIPVKVATLDTGRLFPETYKVFNETVKKYGKMIEVYFPSHEDIEKMETEKGPCSFYYSKEARLECCRIRKTDPLKRALKGIDCWISGIRKDQSENRSRMDQLEYDSARMLFKFYPLFDWTFNDVKQYVMENSIPYNVLHDKGYVSIGCEPCTRVVKQGEDFRAGRWWWEKGGDKECGIHKG